MFLRITGDKLQRTNHDKKKKSDKIIKLLPFSKKKKSIVLFYNLAF